MRKSSIVSAMIEEEKKGMDYYCSSEDNIILKMMCDEINRHLGIRIRYLAEIDSRDLSGSGWVMAKYISCFKSESVRAYLIPQIVADKVNDREQIILSLYKHFKESDEYISDMGKPSPAHIYVRYDNAFRRMKPKRFKKELLELVRNPRDAFYLPFTTRMLASWHIPELPDYLIGFLNDLTPESVGLSEGAELFYPSFDYIKRDLIFTAIDCIKYYNDQKFYRLINQYSLSDDIDISKLAKKACDYMEKHIKNGQ